MRSFLRLSTTFRQSGVKALVLLSTISTLGICGVAPLAQAQTQFQELPHVRIRIVPPPPQATEQEAPAPAPDSEPPTVEVHVPIQAPPQAPQSSQTQGLRFDSEIRAALSSPHVSLIGQTAINKTLLHSLYSLRAFEPVFVTAQGPNSLAKGLQSVLSQAVYRGLHKEDYWLPEIEARWRSRDFKELLQLELLLTESYIRFASDISVGRLNPKWVDSEFEFKKRNFDGFSYLNTLIANRSDLNDGLAKLEPQSLHYQKLQASLIRVLQNKAQHGWKPVRLSGSLKPGDVNPVIPAVRARMVDFGYLPEAERSNSSQDYEGSLVKAVKLLQFNSKLAYSVETADGAIGPQTGALLAKSGDDVIRQISINLEKLRWLPRSLGNNYILVNLARQELKVYEGEAPVLKMNVVVGAQITRTPSIADRLFNVIINPKWTVPDSLVLRKMLPRLKANPNALKAERIKIIDASGRVIDPTTVTWSKFDMNLPPYQFVQDVGPLNSLGLVKFNLTNAQIIYLHDTAHDAAHQSLFKKIRRWDSSGCVRLEKPQALFSYIQPNLRFDPAKPSAAEMMSQPQSYPAQAVPMAKALPVYLSYLTASVDDNGYLQLAPDEYKQDAAIARALELTPTSEDNP